MAGSAGQAGGPPPQIRRQKIADLLAHPEDFPDEFKSWLPRWIGDNPNLKLSLPQLPLVRAPAFVGITAGAAVFTGTWVDLGGGFLNAGYWIDLSGTVHLCGAVKSGSAGTEIFPLPAGFRPQARLGYAVITNTGIGEIDITGTGSVIHITGGTAAVTLDGITFRQYT